MVRALVVLAVLALAACQTDRERHAIGEAERVDAPDLFPPLADQRKWASTKVVYYFKAGRAEMIADPALTLEVFAYFEWLANDLRSVDDVPPHAVRAVLDARADIRRMVKIPDELPAADAVRQLIATSKFLRSQAKAVPSPDAELAARQQLLAAARSRIGEAINTATTQTSGSAGGIRKEAP